MLATTHIAIKNISDNLSESLIINKLDLLFDFCKRFNSNPTIKIAGLNPHFGEEGLMGNEEVEWINNTLKKWQQKNPQAVIIGPVSPDTCWINAYQAWNTKNKNEPDATLAMYHDQGLIPVKIIAFDYAVNTTLGLPFIRTSPDHGTGFDIAGKGIANPRSMIEAIVASNTI